MGRVLIIGDAAHNFPPFGRCIQFGAQLICYRRSGNCKRFRNAFSLTWRLSLIAQHPEIQYEKVFTAWFEERKQQVDQCKYFQMCSTAYS